MTEQFQATVLPTAVAVAETAPPPQRNAALLGFVRERFNRAANSRILIEQMMLEDLRQKRSQYSPAKLAAIRQVMGQAVDPPYPGITEAKCEAVYAWLLDAILPPGQFPGSLEPTPIPELPVEVTAEIEQRVQDELLDRIELQIQQGLVVDAATARAAYTEMLKTAQDEVAHELMEAAKTSARKMMDKIKDQFAECDWEKALKQSLHDLVDIGTAIMRAPILRDQPIRRSRLNPQTRRYEVTYEHDIIPGVERLVPQRFYPCPDATRDSVPWSVYNNASSRKDLASLLDDSSYDQQSVRDALRAYANGYRESTTVEQEKSNLEGRTTTYDSELIDRLEYKGSVQGAMLMEFGLEDLEPEREYDAMIYVVGQYVIKALINPDPVGLNYIFSAGFSEQPDSFWGRSVSRKMRHSQNITCIAARAVVMNVGIASGPLTEVNMDRMWPGQNLQLTPWMVVKATSSMMAEGKAVNYYQPQMVTERLIQVFDFGMRLADYETGLPRILYAGESNSQTAASDSMMITQASKGGQNIVRNVDTGLIVPILQAFFNFNLQYDPIGESYVGDARVVARGSNTQVAKEMKVLRVKEILKESNNDRDAAIFTTNVRAKLWAQAVEALGIDPRLLGTEDEIDARAAQLEQQTLLGQSRELEAATQTLPGTGTQVGGHDAELFASQAGSTP